MKKSDIIRLELTGDGGAKRKRAILLEGNLFVNAYGNLRERVSDMRSLKVTGVIEFGCLITTL